METRAFAPMYGPSFGNTQGAFVASVAVTATTTAAAVNLPGPFQSGFSQLRIANKTTAWAHVNVGASVNLLAATVATSPGIAPGSVEIFSISQECTAISVILDAATTGGTTVNITRGEGL